MATKRYLVEDINYGAAPNAIHLLSGVPICWIVLKDMSSNISSHYQIPLVALPETVEINTFLYKTKNNMFWRLHDNLH